MLAAALYIIVFIIIGVLLFAYTRPDCFQVQRKITIQATPDTIFAYINDLQQWELWSPWENKDPAMKKSFSTVTTLRPFVAYFILTMSNHLSAVYRYLDCLCLSGNTIAFSNDH